MKVIVPTGDLFRGQPILLEIDTEGGARAHESIKEALRHWREFMKDVKKDWMEGAR